MPRTYDIGDTVNPILSVTVAGVLTDATAVTAVVTKPDGSALSPAPTVNHPSVGKYNIVIAPDAAGQWIWKLTATGVGGVPLTVEYGYFYVGINPALTYYATEGELRDRMRDASDKLDGGLLGDSLHAASRAIDEYTKRRFWRDIAVTVTNRIFSVLDPWEPNFAYIDDVATKTGLVVKTDAAGAGTYGTTWASTDYALLPWNADADGGAYYWNELRALNGKLFPIDSSGRPTIQVTATWGWSQVLEQVREACLLKAQRYYRRKDTPDGIAGSSEWGAVRITKQDPDITELLDKLVKRSR